MRQHVTVVSGDSFISVEGEGFHFPFAVPEGLRAVQWHEGAGEMEWQGRVNSEIGPEEYEEIVEPFVELWESEKSRVGQLKQTQRDQNLPEAVRVERDRRMREVYDPAVNQLRRKIDTAQEAGETEEASALRERLFAWHAYANALETLPEQEGFPWNGPQDPEAPWPEEPA